LADDGAWLDAALPEDFHPKLRQRLAKALALAVPGWRETSVLSQASVRVACAAPRCLRR
jgi:hypothetical protein